MIDKKIRSGNKRVDNYIIELEKELQRRDVDGVEKLIQSLNNFSLALSKDVQLVSSGELENLLILSKDKDDKVFERIMSLVGNIAKFQQVITLAQAMDKDFNKVEDSNSAAEGSPEEFVFKSKNNGKK
jgi:hypothetical protein